MKLTDITDPSVDFNGAFLRFRSRCAVKKIGSLLYYAEAVLLAVLIIVVSSFLTAFAFTFIGEILQMLLGVSRQWMYNLPAICALVVTGVLYSTIILRMRRYEVQDALKSGESIRTVVNRRFLSQTLIFLGVFAVGAFLLAWIGIAEHFTFSVSTMGQGYVPSGVKFFVGWERFLFACGAFVPIVPRGWLAWLCSVASYAALLWGGTWWFVRRTDRKLLGKKQTKVQ